MEDEREFKILDPVAVEAELIRKAEIRLCGQRAFCYELIISELFGRNSFGDIWHTDRAANPPLTLAFVTSYDSCLDYRSVGGPTVLKFSPCG
jgi:hypothetical protein